MSEPLVIRVPDIDDCKDVMVIEVLAAPEDILAADASVLVLETERATMEVPALQAGVVTEFTVRVGDRVSAGSVIGVMTAHRPDLPQIQPPAPELATGPAETAAGTTCDLVVLGGGPGGYSAAFRAADLGLDVVLVERFDRLGGVCLNVGCIPSKALLHLSGVIDDVRVAGRHGLAFGEPSIDLAVIRSWKEGVVGRLTAGLAGLARDRKVRTITGIGRFAGPKALRVEAVDGSIDTVSFDKCIIAVGSRPIHLPFLPDDPRIVDSTGALALPAIPSRMLVIGGGIVGLEMATVYASFGAAVDIVERLDHLMPGADRDLVAAWTAANRHRFGRVMTGTRASAVEARADGLWTRFEGPQAPLEAQCYNLMLQAAGRIGNADRLDLNRAGLAVESGGTIAVDAQMRTGVRHIFAIGDIAGAPMLAHKAVHEGHVAAENAAGLASGFDTTTIPSVAYTRPEIAWVGLTEAAATAEGRKPVTSRFPWAASGRAIASDTEGGMTKLLFDEDTGRIVGGGIVGAHAGELIAEVALAIEMGADATDIGKTIHAHPTLSETVGLSAEVMEGVCTDLPASAQRRRHSARVAAS